LTFTFRSGDLALDFAGTVGHRDTDRYDLISSPDAFGAWAVAAGVVDAAPAADEADRARALTVREAIYRLARAAARDGTSGAADQWRQDDVDLINATAAGEPVSVGLAGPGRVHRLGSADAVTATIARAAVELLGGPHANRIRECSNPACTRLFTDTSRAASRRWCDMRECGNQAKVAGFRARHAPATQPAP
jgi:predicted RNA-binding Zn ribbon-like protein